MADGNDASKAIAEGRRIYVGSLRYSATPDDTEGLLQSHGFTHDKIHMSVDPISARNPGYCFVELPTAEEASRALETLNGQELLGRAVKTGPCEAKSATPRYKSYDRSRFQDKEPTFQRWGDWRGSSPRQSADGGVPVEGKDAQSPRRVEESSASAEGRRLFVSGLPKMLNQPENDAEMREFFQGFEVIAVGKRVIPYRFRNNSDGGVNYHHCFVDVSTAEQASAAVDALNGTQLASGGAPVRVSIAKPSSSGLQPRDENASHSPKPRSEGKPRSDGKERPGMASMSWRRVA